MKEVKLCSPCYRLATPQGFKLNIANIGSNVYDDGALAIKENFKDILVTRPAYPTDIDLMDTHALMTVQGLIHPTVMFDDKLYIKNGVEPMLKTKMMDVGFIDFSAVREGITKFQLTKAMIHVSEGYPLVERVNIKLPKEVDGAFLVMGGYIIPERDGYLQRVSNQEFILFPKKLNLINKLYEIARYRNIWKELEVPVSKHNKTVVSKDDVYSDETITKFLMLFNTFFVEVRNHSISYELKPLEHTRVPGNYRTREEVNFPLIGGRGKIIEYKQRDMNRYINTILTTDSYFNNLLLDFNNEDLVELFNDHRNVGSTYRLSPGYFMKMTIERIKPYSKK